MSLDVEDLVQEHYRALRLPDDARRRLKELAEPPQRSWHRRLVAALVLISAVGAGWLAGLEHAQQAASPIPVVEARPDAATIPAGYVTQRLELLSPPRARPGEWVDLYAATNTGGKGPWMWTDHPILLLSVVDDRATVAIPEDRTELLQQASQHPVVMTSVHLERIISIDFAGVDPVRFGDWVTFEDAGGLTGSGLVLRIDAQEQELVLGLPPGQASPRDLQRLHPWTPL